MTFPPPTEMPYWIGNRSSYDATSEECSITVDAPDSVEQDFSCLISSEISPQNLLGKLSEVDLDALPLQSRSLPASSVERQELPALSTHFEEVDVNGLLMSPNIGCLASPSSSVSDSSSIPDWYRIFSSLDVDDCISSDHTDRTPSPLPSPIPLHSPIPQRPVFEPFSFSEQSAMDDRLFLNPTFALNSHRHPMHSAAILSDGTSSSHPRDLRHLMIPSGRERTRSCSSCSEGIRVPDNVPARERIATLSVLRAAAKRRQKVPTFRCSLCGDLLTSKDNLNNHINAHKGIRRFQCEICEKRFGTRSVLNRHKKSLKCLLLRETRISYPKS